MGTGGKRVAKRIAWFAPGLHEARTVDRIQEGGGGGTIWGMFTRRVWLVSKTIVHSLALFLGGTEMFRNS